MSIWFFSPSLLSYSTASRVVLDFILVLSRAIIAAWLSHVMTKKNIFDFSEYKVPLHQTIRTAAADILIKEIDTWIMELQT